MNKYTKEYLEEKIADFQAFRDGMMEARYIVDRQTAIML